MSVKITTFTMIHSLTMWPFNWDRKVRSCEKKKFQFVVDFDMALSPTQRLSLRAMPFVTAIAQRGIHDLFRQYLTGFSIFSAFSSFVRKKFCSSNAPVPDSTGFLLNHWCVSLFVCFFRYPLWFTVLSWIFYCTCRKQGVIENEGILFVSCLKFLLVLLMTTFGKSKVLVTGICFMAVNVTLC